MDENVVNPIPLEVAIQLCDEIREEIDRIWYPTPARYCLCCEQGGCEDPTERGFTREPGNRGCTLVNARYAEMMHKKSAV